MTSRALALSGITVALLAAACIGESDSMDLPGADGAVTIGEGGGDAADACDEEGAFEDCSVDLGTANGVHTCVRGERRCRGGTWGPCEGSLVARPVTDDDAAPTDEAVEGAEGGDDVSTDEPLADERQFADAERRLALTTSEDCLEACDPACEIFPDVVPGSATPASTDVPPPIVGGSRLSFEHLVPSSFQQSLMKSPCTGITGACQTDTVCKSDVCTPYEENEYAVGGVDLTVGLPCGDGAEAKIPICNRGDVTSAGDTKLAFLSANSNQLQNDLSTCTLASNRSFSFECTVPDKIAPGKCVMAPAACSAGLQGNNKALVINPSRAAPNTVTSQAEGAGRCGNNWSWWDDAVTCNQCTPAVETNTVVHSGATCPALTFSSLPTELLTERMVVGSSRTSSSAAWTDLDRVQEAQGCSGATNQYWIDETQLTSVTAHLCPSTCDALPGANAQLRLSVTCPVEYDPELSGTVQFEGVCPTGTRPQWGYLSYNALVPGDSELDIEVRSSGSSAFTGAFHDIAKVTTLDDLLDPPRLDTAACLATDPDPECPVNLWTTLDGPPEGTNPFLEVRWTIKRSTNTRLAPQLHSIETTFTCPWTE